MSEKKYFKLEITDNEKGIIFKKSKTGFTRIELLGLLQLLISDITRVIQLENGKEIV